MLPSTPIGIDYLIDIIRHELGMADERVNVYNQKFAIPNDQFLFIGVEYKFSKPFGSKSEAEDIDGAFSEKQGLQTQEKYTVILFSRNTDALRRKEEAVMALNSIYTRQQSDKYGFKIFRIAPIQDLSSLEGAAILYRLEIDVTMFCRYEKIKSMEYYGTFSGDVTVEDGQDVTATFEPILPT